MRKYNGKTTQKTSAISFSQVKNFAIIFSQGKSLAIIFSQGKQISQLFFLQVKKFGNSFLSK